MASEHVAVATARAVIARLKVPCAFLDVKTDALNLLVAAKHLPKVQQAVESIRHYDLSDLSRKLGQKTLLDQHGLFPRTGTEPVFRFRAEGSRLKGRFRTPQRVASPPVEINYWRDLSQEEPPKGSNGSLDLRNGYAPSVSQEVAREHVLK